MMARAALALVMCVTVACGEGGNSDVSAGGAGAGGAAGSGGGGGSAGGEVQTLFEETEGCGRAPIAVDDTHLYFTWQPAQGATCGDIGDVKRLPKAGGAVETVLSGLPMIPGGVGTHGLAASGGFVFIATTEGLSRWSTSNATHDKLHSESVEVLRIDDQHAYWVTTNPDYSEAIHRSPLGGGSIEEVVASEPSISDFVVDATHLYYVGNHSIDRVPLTGGATETVVTTDKAIRVEVGGDFVYWLTFDQIDSGSVHRSPKTGGPDEVLGSGAVGFGALLIDSNHVYFADGNQSGVVSVDLTTKVAYPRETGISYTHELAADGEHVYIRDVFGLRRTPKWP